MRTVPLRPGTSLRLFSSIFELPAGRHNEFQYWLLRESGIGSGAQAIDRHFHTVSAFLAAGETEKAADALALLHYAHGETLDRFSSQHLAFGCLVAEWPLGQPFTDLTEAGLTQLRDALSAAGLTEGLVQEEVERTKKELRRS